LRGVKLKDRLEIAELNFDFNAKLDEKERRSGKCVIGFILTVGTKPSISKFEVEGIATIEGKNPEIEKLLEVNPKTKIPLLLNRVYHKAFTSIYLLANLLDTAYPPSDMLTLGQIVKQGINSNVEIGRKEETKTEEKSTPKQKGKTKKKR